MDLEEALSDVPQGFVDLSSDDGLGFLSSGEPGMRLPVAPAAPTLED